MRTFFNIINYLYLYLNIFFNAFKNSPFFNKYMGIGDWGLGIGDWGLGPIPNPQSPIPILKKGEFLKALKNIFKYKYK